MICDSAQVYVAELKKKIFKKNSVKSKTNQQYFDEIKYFNVSKEVEHNKDDYIAFY